MKSILVLVTILFFCIFLSCRYQYIKKNDNKIYISSKGKAIEWCNVMLESFLQKKYPDKELVYTNISNPDLLIVSNFFSWEDYILYTEPETPYISWSGEPKRVPGYEHGIHNLLTSDIKEKNDIWTPFLLVQHFQNGRRIDKIINQDYPPIRVREFLVVYISGHKVNIREKLFELFSQKSDTAHARGTCSNNYPKVEGIFTDLDNVYEEYMFGFAMENCKKPGYITEKILNVYRGGAIPIFWGDSTSAQTFFEKDTYIDVSDFDSLDNVVDYVIQLSKDKKQLEKIKSKPIFKDKSYFEDIEKMFKLSLDDI